MNFFVFCVNNILNSLSFISYKLCWNCTNYSGISMKYIKTNKQKFIIVNVLSTHKT
jgi:hypothetical protein